LWPTLLRLLAAQKVPVIYVAAAILLFCIWPFLSVNSNSLHQL
jgi:hypothetical protein